MVARLSTRFLVAGAGLLSLLSLPACLERKEMIRVDRSGAAELTYEVKGDATDANSGDALPDERDGWSTQSRIETDKDGKQELHLNARLNVPAGKPLPASLAAEADADVCLRTPGEVRIEKRADGTYYHFKRTYAARPEASYERHLKAIREDEELKRVSGISPEEMSDEDRVVVLDALRRMEAAKRCEYLRAAAAALGDQIAPDYELLAQHAVRNHLENADLTPMLDLLGKAGDSQRDAAVAKLVDEELSRIPDQIRDALREARASKAVIEKLLGQYEREQARRSITEDLNDDKFEVKLQLPGELVAHNGKLAEDGIVQWEFSGEDLHDRDVVLLATSRVER